jgi:hypothetical protein
MTAAICASVAGAVVASALADDNGAEEYNAAAADSSRTQAAIANDQWQNYKKNYQPLENALVAEATNYDSPENYAKAAGEAAATNASEFGKVKEALGRTPGLDPSSSAYQAGMTQLGLQQAASSAVTQNAARQGVADTAYARKLNAISLGKGLPAQASAGLSSVAGFNANMAANAQAQANQTASGWGSLATRAFTGIANYNNTPAATTSASTSGGGPSADYIAAMNQHGTLGGYQQTSGGGV